MKILFVLGGGIGNIIQATPTIKIISNAGHTIDLKLFCDSTGDVREIFSLPMVRRVYTSDEPNESYDCQLKGIFVPGKNYPAKKYYRTRANYAQNLPESQVYVDLARQLGITGELPDIEINVGRDGPKPKHEDTIAFYTGSKPNWAMKRWDKYDKLASQFSHVAVVGTPQDINSHGNPSWIKTPWNWPDNVEFFSGSLRQAAYFISKCKFFVGNDGGLAHVAAATGIPTFVIFGPSSFIKNRPFSKKTKVVGINIPCRPCQFKKGPDGKEIFGSNKASCPNNMRCMRDLTIEQVVKCCKI